MKKVVKIFGLLLATPFLLFLLAAIVIPIFFKDQIKAAVDQTIEEYISATVDYKQSSLSISLFSDFPNAEVSIEDLSIVNKAPFQGDTLASLKSMSISLDIKSLLTDNLTINGIYLEQPRVLVQVNENGFASYDIVVPDSSASDTSSSPFTTKIDHWQIIDGFIDYQDKTLPLHATVTKFNHSGQGVFGEKINLLTNSSAEKLYVDFDNITYLDHVNLDAVTNIDIDDSKISFAENKVKLNDLSLFFDGFTSFEEESIEMDLKLETKENTFKSLLSLIPSIFLEGYDQVQANGTFNLDGFLKGTYSDSQYPAFSLALNVAEGDFKHPQLPKKISDVNLSLKLNNEDGVIENTSLQLKDMQLKMGQNYLKGRFFGQGLDNPKIDTDLKLKLNLGEVKDFYPLDSITLNGLVDLQVAGKGTVDVDNNKFPSLNGFVNLNNGFVKTADFDLPLQDINFNSTYKSDGTAENSELDMNDIQVSLDGQEIGGKLSVKNFQALNYKVGFNGEIDLGKLFHIFPVEGMTLDGFFDVKEFATEGNLKAIENEDYAALKTSGSAEISNLNYIDDENLPYGLRITSSHFDFSPKEINITKYNGFIGQNDVSLKGNLTNYMGYLFGEGDTILAGKMVLESDKFDVNLFLTDEEEATEPDTTEPVVIIPKDVHFLFDATMKEMIYDDLTMSNFMGSLEVVDGKVVMDQVKFKTLGAQFITSGEYNTSNESQPKYEFDLKVDNMKITQAYKYFSVVKELSPIAKKVEGFFNTDIALSGNLLDGYMPDMTSLSMSGDLDIIDAVAKVSDIKVLSSLADKANLKGFKEYKIKDQKLGVVVDNGKLKVNPFTMTNGTSSLTSQLNSGIADNTINHVMNLDIPSTALKTGVSSFGLDPSKIGDRIKLNFDILGTNTNPKINLKNAGSDGIKAAIKDKVEDKIDETKEEVKDRAKEAAEKAKREAEAKAKAEAERIKKEAEQKAKEKAKDKVGDVLKDNGLSVPWKK